MALATRADSIINAHALAAGCTPAGLTWLKKTIDPFADLNTKLEGYPDTCSNPAVNQRIKLSYTISAPAGTGTNNWDCNIVMLPWINALLMKQQTGPPPTQNLFENANVAGQPIGGLSYFAGPSGSNLDYATCSTNSGGYFMKSFQLDSSYYQGSCRATSIGFEVRNTTAVLNLQGSVIVYRQPIPDYETATNVFLGTASDPNLGYTDALLLPCPPTNVAAAMILGGSRKWEAKEGVYIPLTLNSNSIPIQNELFVSPIMYSDTATNRYYVPDRASTRNGVNFYADNFWTKFNTSGAYFTGLSSVTTLDLELIIDIERFPSERDAQLIVLVEPSPKYDPVALQLYSHITQDLPPGVMVRENGLGDWLMECAGRIKDVVMPILRPLGKANPKVGALVGVVDNFLTSKRDKKGQGLIVTGGAVNVKPKNKPKQAKTVVVSSAAPKAPKFNLAAYNAKPKGGGPPKIPPRLKKAVIAQLLSGK